ncbi:DUF4167 domain-containing protein [Mesorhizobium sp. IMUNJ 23232]|uniref:DUF4167 domain-containing protein n=1 Tax=Mesorhizobium sp. IMUNJ 23232 TaxID=3376064 RepID=UPI0037A33562
MRGRNNGGGGNNNNNNNNRRGPNPLTRNYESNGPDVKIRGSAQQIAEKYTTLARDAQSSGDRVMAENYLQHAEHYNRIIAAAQAQFASQQPQSSPRDDLDDDMDDASYGYEGGMNGGESYAPPAQAPVQQHQPQPQNQHQPQPQHQPQHQPQPVSGSGPQPVIEGVPAEVALNSEPAGRPTGGGRHRDRRHQHPRHNGTNGASVSAVNEATEIVSSGAAEETPVQQLAPEQAPEPVPAAVAASEVQEAQATEEQPRPRRGRRPRRSQDAPASDAAGSQGELLGGSEGAGGESAPIES